MPPLFVLFGPSHLTAIALTLTVPLALALLARHEHLGRHADRLARIGLAGFLAVGWICWYGLTVWRHELRLGNGLPMNLCDWAEIALIVALLTRGQFAYELGYFWGLGATLQGVLTPPLYYNFPDLQFIFFFIQHGGVVAALLYLTLGTRMRPTPRSLPRVIAASFAYLGAAALACTVIGTRHPLPLMIILFAIAATGLKSYLPAFWTLPSLFLTEAAAAGSIGLINSVGNLGGFIGPKVLGYVETQTGSFKPGILFLCVSIATSATIIIVLGLGDRAAKTSDITHALPDPDADAIIEPA